MRYLLTNLERMSGGLFVVRDTLEQLAASIAASWDVEHTNAGGHAFTQTLWTPVIGGSTGTSGQTYAQQEGYYVNIGGLIIAPFRAFLSAKGTVSGDAQLQGLPVRSATMQAPGIIYTPYWANFTIASTQVGGLVESNSTKATIYEDTGGGSGTAGIKPASDIGNTSLLHGIAVYLAAT